MTFHSTPFLRRLEAACDRAALAPSTRRAYGRWACQLLAFSKWPPPGELSAEHAHKFTTFLAEEEQLAPATVAQARSALRFLFREVLERKLVLPPLVGAETQQPYVLSEAEARSLIVVLAPPYDLIARLIYGCGLHSRECLRLRVRDADLVRRQLCVRDARGSVSRRLALPEEVLPYLWHHLAGVQEQHQRDRAVGAGYATPTGRFSPSTPVDYRSWSYQYLFPSPRLAMLPTWRRMVRHHIHVTTLYKQLRAAARMAGLAQPVTAHTLRHSFAARRLAAGDTPEQVQAQLGLQHASSMRIYKHLWE